LKRIHRILGLSFLLFWLIEALSGAWIEGLWWLDRAVYGEPASEIRADIVGSSVRNLSADASVIYSAWSAGNVPNQVKIFYKDRLGKERVRRISNSGRLLYDVGASDLSTMEGELQVLIDLHQSLLAGSFGVWVTALSGAMLTVTLCIGLWMVCRLRMKLKVLLLWRPTRARLGRAMQAHRLAGVWLVLPGLVLAATGAALALHSALEPLGIGSEDTPVAAARVQSEPHPELSIERIISQALETEGGSTFSAITLPTAETPWYEVRLKSRSDGQAFWGSRAVRISRSGSLIPGKAGSPFVFDRTSSSLYAIHTGQSGGAWGEGVAFAAGLLLILTAVLGIVLWLCRRAVRQPAN
jgi:uncharacterized iron-regulated membrane protein